VRLIEVPVAPWPPDRFRSVLGDRYAEAEAEMEEARSLLEGRAVWHVNSTARGGGVAEMLRSLLAYVRGAGIDARWMVIEGEAPFFEVTKRIHNHLHGSPGDGGALAGAERETYESSLATVAGELASLVRPGDVVFLHDPQTVGLAPVLAGRGVPIVWRCHVGIDNPNEIARGAWKFLRGYADRADAYVFSRREFVWEGLDESRVWIVPPTIDVFSPKNQDLPPEAVASILDVIGLTDAGERGGPLFRRGDGTPARVDREAALVQEEPLPADAPLVAQVSRWDRLKDPLGVLDCFAEHVTAEGAHLALVGPDTEAVGDDPEGAEVFADVRAAVAECDASFRHRVHLVSLPMVDLDENAAMVNAIQRHASVVVQKSLAEGFGLTVAEAMWKERPVVASRVGGIQDQIVDGESGFLIDDPTDLAAAGKAISDVLGDPALAARVGENARRRVNEKFLALDRLLEYFRHIRALISG
jgi:trehalose synthase